MNNLKALLLTEDKIQVVEFTDKLDNFYRLLECETIQAIDIADVTLVFDDEGKFKNQDDIYPNIYLLDSHENLYDVIVGNILILNTDYNTGEFTSITDEQIEKYKGLFSQENGIRKIINKEIIL